jgi:hypothetical protein
LSTLSRVNFGNCRYSITVGWGGRATGTRPPPPHPAILIATSVSIAAKQIGMNRRDTVYV